MVELHLHLLLSQQYKKKRNTYKIIWPVILSSDPSNFFFFFFATNIYQLFRFKITVDSNLPLIRKSYSRARYSRCTHARRACAIRLRAKIESKKKKKKERKKRLVWFFLMDRVNNIAIRCFLFFLFFSSHGRIRDFNDRCWCPVCH